MSTKLKDRAPGAVWALAPFHSKSAENSVRMLLGFEIGLFSYG